MKYLFICFISLLLVACQPQATDRATQLEKLKQEQQALDDQIKSLQAELGVPADSAQKNNQTLRQTMVQVTEIRPQSFSHFLEMQGTVACKDNIGVSPKQPGIIAQVMVVEGQQVSKGDLLATLDDAVFKQGMLELQTGLEFARTIYAKQKALWDKQIGTEVQFLTAKNNVETLERKLNTLSEQAELYKILAPISGTVDEVNVNTGEGAMVGMPAFRVVSLNNMKVEIDVPETYVGKVKRGQSVEVFLPDLNRTVQGKVSRMGTVINNINRSFKTEVSLAANQGLLPNMVAMVKFVEQGANNAIVAPVNSILSSEQGTYVFIANGNANKGGTAQKRLIKTGLASGNGMQVLEGLKVGDLVITEGFQDLNDGQEIKW